MCGFIAGKDIPILNYDKILDSISYRGLPKYKGKHYGRGFFMGHYSLPFVNLDLNIARQPIYNPLDHSSVVFAGEIFNYTDFKKNNQEYKTDAYMIASEIFDVEKSQPDWNKFHQFDGFWSIATIFNGKLIAITDYLAQKPVYYRTDMNVVASEIDVLKQFGPVTPNELFFSNVMKWGYDPRPRTPWNEIRQIPPGYYYEDGVLKKYWNWDLVEDINLVKGLYRSVDTRMGGQREVPILLSGGLDSTIIYKILEDLGYPLITIHVDNGEEDYINLVTKEYRKAKLDEIRDEEAVEIHQTPVDLGSVKPQIAMAREIQRLGYYAVMTGDGADELFGGYARAKEYDSQASDVFMELPYYHLPKLDRTMMRSTIELRAPFLAPYIVKYALNIPYSIRDGEKKILKKLFGYLVPPEILNREKRPLKTDSIRNDPMNQRKINRNIWRSLYGV